MIKLKKWIMNPCQTACHVLSDETRECVIVDACAYYNNERSRLVEYIREERLKPVRHLLTHGHFDHLLCSDLIRDEYGLLPEVHEYDKPVMWQAGNRINEVFGEGNFPYVIPVPEHYLTDREVVRFGHHRLEIIHTPGHSPGSVFIYCEEEGLAFSGDTLFSMSIGRTDLPGGNVETLKHSLKMIMEMLPDSTVIHPGHTGKTTIGHERLLNPYIDFTT